MSLNLLAPTDFRVKQRFELGVVDRRCSGIVDGSGHPACDHALGDWLALSCSVLATPGGNH